jgi:hypothetical protein
VQAYLGNRGQETLADADLFRFETMQTLRRIGFHGNI